VTSDERLAALYTELRELGVPCLVMGGHAVRFHGVDRNTIDYDFHLALAADEWTGLHVLLRRSRSLTAAREEPSWRPADFRRFSIGRLPDGRDELFECWRRNHLLRPFEELHAARAEGPYGGRTVAFLGLADLIRSKETEREDDWRDVALLEEIADARNLASASSPRDAAAALRQLRSRRGYDAARARGLLAQREALVAAAGAPVNVMAAAFLAPHAPRELAWPAQEDASLLELADALRRVAPASPRHLALVEAVRRLYRRAAMEADRADKEAALERPADPRS
jgi:hypothetical protein